MLWVLQSVLRKNIHELVCVCLQNLQHVKLHAAITASPQDLVLETFSFCYATYNNDNICFSTSPNDYY